MTPGSRLPAQVVRLVDNNNVGDIMLDTNDMRSPTISRTNEIKYKIIRSSKHAKRSNVKKNK